MYNNTIFERNPALKEFLHLFRHELQQCQRPACEVVMDDEDVMKFLKISKRRLQYMKTDRILPVHKFDAESPRTYFLLSDILEVLKKNRIESIDNKRKF